MPAPVLARLCGEARPASPSHGRTRARSVNGRFLDLALRLPDEMRVAWSRPCANCSPAPRSSAARSNCAWPPSATAGTLPGRNPGRAAEPPGRTCRTVQGWLPRRASLSVNEVLQWCRSATPGERWTRPRWTRPGSCIQGLREARAREGERLATMLLDRVAGCANWPAGRAAAARGGAAPAAALSGALERSPGRPAPAAAVEPLAQALAGACPGRGGSFAIRIDVAEELSRLASHLDEIERLLKAGGELGKRLDFLIQELQREANTLGSKSAALELTNLSVEMKVAGRADARAGAEHRVRFHGVS
jgi:hypothetical protein